MTKLSKLLFASTLSLSACVTTQIQIKDGEWCGDKGRLGASCFHTLSDESRRIAKPDWDNVRFGMICTKANNFLDWKAAIDKLCGDSQRCSYEVKQAVAKFSARVDSYKLSASRDFDEK